MGWKERPFFLLNISFILYDWPFLKRKSQSSDIHNNEPVLLELGRTESIDTYCQGFPQEIGPLTTYDTLLNDLSDKKEKKVLLTAVIYEWILLKISGISRRNVFRDQGETCYPIKNY